MAGKGIPGDLQHAVQVYESGTGLVPAARAGHVNIDRLRQELVRQGLRRDTAEQRRRASTARRAVIPVDQVVKRYSGGESELTIARSMGVDRRVVRRALTDTNVPIRGRGAAMRIRMGQTTLDERQRLTAAANVARRSRPAGIAELEAKARTAQQTLHKTGAGELRLYEMLAERGLHADLQLAVSKYNIDLAIAPVAVEVHVTTRNPQSMERHRQRIEDLADRGWISLYVWLRRAADLSEGAAEYVVAILEQAKADPASVGKYRVIRGSGQDVTVDGL